MLYYVNVVCLVQEVNTKNISKICTLLMFTLSPYLCNWPFEITTGLLRIFYEPEKRVCRSFEGERSIIIIDKFNP